MKRLSVLLTVIFLAVGPGLAEAGPESDSYVIGRITGTHQELPGYFRNNEHLAARGIDEVEFTGLRLVREEDGKSFIIVPNLHGYFYQALPAGVYTLIRKRYDRPGYREPKTIAIMKFEVESGTLVNLGTVHLILDGPPRESLRLMGDNAKGTYTYRYRYERETGDSAYEMPLSWFTDKKPAVKAGFGDKIVQEETQPTREMDGSKVTLREVIPWTKK